LVFRFGLLLECIRAFEGYLKVCLFKEVGDFPDFGTVKGESDPFFACVVGFVGLGFVFYLRFQFCDEVLGDSVIVCDGEYFLPFCFLSFCCEG
jgi:hypothetical protein